MTYVDGFVIAIHKKNVTAYKKMALLGKKAWMAHGALDYYECVADDLKIKKGMGGVSFTKLAKLKAGETVVFSFIVFKSRRHRDQVNKKVMADFAKKGGSMEMPFNMDRFSYGGFKTIVQG